MVSRLVLNRDRAEAAASGLLLATDAADYLVGRGVPFRRAHEIVGALVQKASRGGQRLRITQRGGMAGQASDLFGADVAGHA